MDSQDLATDPEQLDCAEAPLLTEDRKGRHCLHTPLMAFFGHNSRYCCYCGQTQHMILTAWNTVRLKINGHGPYATGEKRRV